MRCARLVFILAAVLAAGPAFAGQGPIPPPPKATCQPCQPPEQRLRDLEAEQARLRDDIARRTDSIQRLDREIEADQTYLKNLYGSKLLDTSQPDSPGTVHYKEVEVRILKNSIMRSTLRIYVDDDTARLNEIETTLLPAVREELNRCSRVCLESLIEPADPPVTAGDPPADPPPPMPPPQCQPCEPPAEEFRRLGEERRQLSELIDRLDREIRELEAVNARERQSIEQIRKTGSEPKYADHQHIVDEMIRSAQQRIDANTNSLEGKQRSRQRAREWRDEIDERLPELRDQIYKCNASCRMPTPRTWYLVGGGAGALAAILASGGGDATVAAAPPSAAPPPVAMPAPTPSPMPAPPPAEPAPTIAGVHDCVECTVLEDAGGHNASVRLCDFAGGAWEVVVASITIRHAAPFVNIEGAAFDTATGVFRGSARGTVAGVSGVGIAVEGTANAQTGRMTFTYTMGTGGELPGGRAITYRLTLQKRR